MPQIAEIALKSQGQDVPRPPPAAVVSANPPGYATPPDWAVSEPAPFGGMPQDRLARMAARRAFVDLKQDFMMATAGLPGARGEWLRERVRKAEDPHKLWLLRGSLFSALGGDDPEVRTIRHALKTGLDSLFTDSDLGPPTR
jgi:hypothetical protein